MVDGSLSISNVSSTKNAEGLYLSSSSLCHASDFVSLCRNTKHDLNIDCGVDSNGVVGCGKLKVQGLISANKFVGKDFPRRVPCFNPLPIDVRFPPESGGLPR